MNITTTSATSFTRAARLLLVLAFASALLVSLVAGCGGVGVGGTGTYASGPITGFGSVIVNGVRFDDSSASVLDEDGGSRIRSELKLGMTVDIDSDAIRSDSSGSNATASRIRFGSEIVGPLQSVDLAGGTLRVLGQTVRVAVETIFDDRIAGGIAGLSAGQVVEVYALFDAARGSYNATRIEPRAGAAAWRLRGLVSSLDPLARTLVIGGSTFVYATANGVPANLAAGSYVRLRLNTALDGAGRYVVNSFGVAVRAPEDRDEAKLRGAVTAFTSLANFQVNGLAVDASAATFPDGAAGVALGARLQIEGATRAGVLVASKVEIETDDELRGRGFELIGNIESVNPAARTFVLRGVTVSTARPDLRLDDGTLADIAAGREVEVRAELAANRTVLEATRIKFR